MGVGYMEMHVCVFMSAQSSMDCMRSRQQGQWPQLPVRLGHRWAVGGFPPSLLCSRVPAEKRAAWGTGRSLRLFWDLESGPGTKVAQNERPGGRGGSQPKQRQPEG